MCFWKGAVKGVEGMCWKGVVENVVIGTEVGFEWWVFAEEIGVNGVYAECASLLRLKPMFTKLL